MPEELAIVGYDDIALSSLVAVPITTIRQPVHAMAVAAAEMLINEIENSGHEHERRTFIPTIVTRASTGRSIRG